MGMRIWPWALVLLLAIAGITGLAFGRRGDPVWQDGDPAAVEPDPAPAGAPGAATLQAGLPEEGRLTIDVSTILGEQTGQRRVTAGWRLRPDGAVVLHEPAEEDMVMPGDVIATAGADGAVTLSGFDLPPHLRSVFAEGVRALLALREPLRPGRYQVGDRVPGAGQHSVVTAAGPSRLALAAEASPLPGAEGDETLVTLDQGVPTRIERQWTRRDGATTVVTRATLVAR